MPKFNTLSSHALAFLTLRLWLGIVSLLKGLEKFAGASEASGKEYGIGLHNGLSQPLADKLANEPLLPSWLYQLYAAGLGYALIAVGALLILGAFPRIVLFVAALLYTGLAAGLVLVGENESVAWLGVHIALIAGALMLSPHNRLAIFGR